MPSASNSTTTNTPPAPAACAAARSKSPPRSAASSKESSDSIIARKPSRISASANNRRTQRAQTQPALPSTPHKSRKPTTSQPTPPAADKPSASWNYPAAIAPRISPLISRISASPPPPSLPYPWTAPQILAPAIPTEPMAKLNSTSKSPEPSRPPRKSPYTSLRTPTRAFSTRSPPPCTTLNSNPPSFPSAGVAPNLPGRSKRSPHSIPPAKTPPPSASPSSSLPATTVPPTAHPAARPPWIFPPPVLLSSPAAAQNSHSPAQKFPANKPGTNFPRTKAPAAAVSANFSRCRVISNPQMSRKLRTVS